MTYRLYLRPPLLYIEKPISSTINKQIGCNKMRNGIRIRKYHPNDYQQVTLLYQDGIKEVDSRAHQSFYNGVFPQLLICEFLIFFGGCLVGIHVLGVGYFQSFICGQMALISLCYVSLCIRWAWTKRYLRWEENISFAVKVYDKLMFKYS